MELNRLLAELPPWSLVAAAAGILFLLLILITQPRWN